MAGRFPFDVEPTTVPIYLSPRLGLAAEYARDGLVLELAPGEPSSWNDFGHNLWVKAAVHRPEQREYDFDVMMLFNGSGQSSSRLRAIVPTDKPVLLDREEHSFNSILVSDEDYALLVAALGFDHSVAVLHEMGDLVLLNSLGESRSQEQAMAQEAFHFAAMRQERTWTALRHAARHLRRRPAPSPDDAAASFGMRALLPSSEAPLLAGFDFSRDPLMRDRLIVLIGENGVGKSQLLLSLIDGLREDGTGRIAYDQSQLRFVSLDNGKLKFGRPQFRKLLLFSSTVSDDYPKEIAPWEGLDYEHHSLVRDLRDKHGRHRLTLALVDCMRDDRRTSLTPPDPEDDPLAASADRYRLLRRILEPLGLLKNLYLPLNGPLEDRYGGLTIEMEGRTYHPFLRLGSEQRRLALYRAIDLTAAPVVLDGMSSFRRLSSGETAMLRFAAQAIASIERGSLLLFDEPETHLHPRYVSIFVDILHGLLVNTGSAAIAATHSPYLVREVPSSRVRVMRLERGDLTFEAPRMQTFGASIDRISDDVFFDSDTEHQYESTLKDWVSKLDATTTIEDVIERYGETMNGETLSLVRRLLQQRIAG